ncbi:pirin family protein [Tenuifilaceae bacterium CYCD]|nr:pirin family protein [Tenuifilaceae bacterium CYCD]
MLAKVKSIIRAKAAIEGAGVRLSRVLDFQTRYQTDPFLLLDHFGSDNPKDYQAGFPWHPHRGIETVTYMMQGEIEHSDSLGNVGVIGPGDVQWMTAGSGIIHQEMPKPLNGLMYGFQLWVNLPQEYKMFPPRYRELKATNIPIVETTKSRVKVIAGRFRKKIGGITELYTAIDLFDVKLWPDSTFDETINADYNYYLYVYDGMISLPDFEHPIRSMEAAILDRGRLLQIKAGDNGANFLIFGGQPLNEPIAWRGPIVMNTEDEVNLAFDEFYNGNFIK